MTFFRIAAVAAAAWGMSLSPVWAQAVFSEVEVDNGGARSGAASPQTEAIARIKADKTTRSVSIVRIDGALLRGARGRNVELNVRPDVRLDAKPQSVEEVDQGRFVWTGEILANQARASGSALPAGAATIVVNGADATGTIQTPDGKLFKLQPIGGGQNALIEVDQKRLPPEHPPGGPKVQPKNRSDLLPDPAEDTARTAGPRRPVIDLVVAYTTIAKVAAGDIRSLIDLAVAETKKSFVNSGINASVRLVHTVEYSYPDTGKVFDDIIDEFHGSGDGHMDSIHALRDQHGGDVAVLIVENGEYCGVARDIGAVAGTAYAIVSRNCATGYFSFGHEIGHLAGARHDPKTDPDTTPFAYGHGFRRSHPDKGWRTIMGYACDDGSCQPRIQYWSNPAKKRGVVAMGSKSKQNNVRVWNERAAKMAAFKTARPNAGAVAGPPVGDPPASVTSDAPLAADRK